MADPIQPPTARHRVDPMRPANPHTADEKLESYYEEALREGRTGPNLTAALITIVGFLLCAAVFVGIVTVGVWLYAEYLSP
jgi:hypothetical protein